jgi:hypothetical protein
MASLPILIAGKTVAISGTGRFSSAEQFQEGVLLGAFPIKAIGFNFTKHFSDQRDPSHWSISVVGWRLRRAGTDREVIQALGGQAAASMPLSQVHALMGRTYETENIGHSCVAYCFSSQNQLWAINCILDQDKSWIVGAAEVPHEYLHWNVGTVFFASSKKEEPPASSQTVVKLKSHNP